MDKPDYLRFLDSFWSYEEADKMETVEIIQRLENMGIPFNKDAFLRDCEIFYSAEQLSENWWANFPVTAQGRDEDFPFFAALILWERMAPPHILSMEQMSDLIDEGFEYLSNRDYKSACDAWLKVWEAIKYRHKPEHKTMDFLEKQYSGSFFVSNLCQDIENELRSAGWEDNTYFEKRINFCKEFLAMFPDENKTIIHNMRRSIAESYSYLGNYEQADIEYLKLVEDFSDNPWGYIGWGDIYCFGSKTDYKKAEELYKKALAIAKDEDDILVVEERLEDLMLEKRGEPCADSMHKSIVEEDECFRS